jgi:hypothetical protein
VLKEGCVLAEGFVFAKETDDPTRLATRFRFWLLMALVVVVLACGIWVGFDYATYDGRIHRGISIAGVDVGGMTPDEATAAIGAAANEARQKPITLTGNGVNFTLMPDDVGTTVDVRLAVAQAMGITRYDDFLVDAVKRTDLFFHGQNVPLRGAVDSTKLEDMLTQLGWRMNKAPVDAGLEVKNGKIQVTEAQSGQTVDRYVLTQRLEALLYTLHSTTLPVPMTATPPAVQPQDNRAALQKAEIMLSGPVSLVSGDHEWTITTEQLSAWLEFAVGDDNGMPTLTPHLSAARMASFFDSIAGALKRAPTKAGSANDGQKAQAIPGVPGQALDRAGTAVALNQAAAKSSGRTATAALVMVTGL